MKDYDLSTLCRNADGEVTYHKCEVTGTIPSWLSGVAFYNGPGKLQVNKDRFCHVFDGLSLMQRFQIKNGDVFFTCKFLESIIYKECMEQGKITRPAFGTPGPPSKTSFFSKLAKAATDTDSMYSDNSNLNLIKIGNKLIAISEVPVIFEVDYDTLKVVHRVNLYDKFGIVILSVHFHQIENDFYTLGFTFGILGTKYVIIKFPGSGTIKDLQIIGQCSPRYRYQPSYIHSIGLCDNYILLVEHPLHLVMKDILRDIFTNSPFVNSIKWTNEKVNFQIVNRRTWKTVPYVYVSDPFFFLHIDNCYEEKGHLVFNISSYKDSSILKMMYTKSLNKAGSELTKEEEGAFYCKLNRFVLPLEFPEVGERRNLLGTACSAVNNGKEIHLQWEEVSKYALEHPAINNKYFGKKNRYVFGNCFPDDGTNCGMVLKVDKEKKETIVFKKYLDHPTTTIFVPRPGSTKEDDGVVICYTLYGADVKTVKLIFLDGNDMSVLATAVAKTNATMPMPMHGNFYPS